MTCRRSTETTFNPGFLLNSFLVLQCSLLFLVSGQRSATRFQTFSGNPPKVIARGGFSGLLPDSSYTAYQVALITSVPDVVFWCDVQLTKDAVGICASDVRLENSTRISSVFPNREKTYIVNGIPTSGYFASDFAIDELSKNVPLMQGILSRTSRFDGNSFQILMIEDVAGLKPQALWLNVQHDAFYAQHNLSMRNYVLSVSRRVVINYISSPELGFLRSIAGRLNSNATKLVFRALGPNDIEPSTNQTYGNLLSNLTFIKTFASAIILSKTYIYPVDSSGYIQPHTSIVMDAHKAGLEIFASDFYNDVPLSYNYSYDPIAESLHYMDNGDFSVDGVLTDFPITPSLARDCFAHIGRNASDREDFLVISKNGASGDYPGCTDKAYQKAILDGTDVIDCPVQISQNGIPFCLGSINLYASTNVAQSRFTNRAMRIPELVPGKGSGIFAFNLTWAEIQTLKPAISNPFTNYELFRNPKARNDGKFVSLSEFLELAKNISSLTGVLINIENAAYLMEKQGLPVIDTVLKTLNAAGYGNQTAKRVMIQSTDSSVLMKFKGTGNYEIVYEVEEDIRDILDSAVDDIKQFAQAVVVSKSSVFSENDLFLTGSSGVVSKLQSAKLPVYVKTFSNEFVSQAWDFFSDPTVEINTYVVGANISGVITEFPLTSTRYKKNRCLGPKAPPFTFPVQPGSLMQLITPEYMPPAEAPHPVLNENDITESPLPSILAEEAPSSTPAGGPAVPSPKNGQAKVSAGIFMSNLAAVFVILLLLSDKSVHFASNA